MTLRLNSRATVLGLGLYLSQVACSGDEPAPSDATGGAGGHSGDPCDITLDTSTYEYDLNLPRSYDPPGGLAPEEVPQFVALGWDDNGFLASFDWAIQMLADRELASTFFFTTTYISDGSITFNSDPLRTSWRGAYDDGHEIGHHTQYHLDGEPFTPNEWATELDTGFQYLTAPFDPTDPEVEPGLEIPREKIYGFRSPFLHYNDALFPELRERGIWYDCSIEEGWQLGDPPSRFAWPYTLDEGSPAHDYARERDFDARGFDLGSHPGIIELPAYAVAIPPDEVADEYGIDEGLLDKVRSNIPAPEPGSDRLTGLDYNLWWEGHMTKEEAVAVLKYNLDQRLLGNRAPFLFGVHSDFYRDDWGSDETTERRREAIEEFLDYAASIPEVRIVTFKQVVDFLRQPRPLECYD